MQQVVELGGASLFKELNRWLIVYGTWRDPEHDAVPVLQHALQAATRAEGETGNTDDIVMMLLHKAAMPLSGQHYGEVIAEIMRGRLSDDHTTALYFQAAFAGAAAGVQWETKTWYSVARQLARWDQISYDPTYPVQPLSHFAERLLQVCER